MRFGLNQYLTQPVTLIGVLVVAFGVLAALVKFLSDLLAFIKNARDLRGSPEPGPSAATRAQRRAFVPGQTPHPTATVFTKAAYFGSGWGLGKILAREHGGHLPHDHGLKDAGHSLPDADVGDAGHSPVDADGGHAVLQPDGHPLANLDAHHHGLWDVIRDGFDSLSDS
jgi:hypothetical protein